MKVVIQKDGLVLKTINLGIVPVIGDSFLYEDTMYTVTKRIFNLNSDTLIVHVKFGIN